MEYRTHQGERLSEIGLGCYALSGAYGSIDREEFRRVIRRAHELGVTVYDTAEGYGEAEEFLGKAIRPFREQFFLATKVGMREGIRANLSPDYLRAACEGSLRRLRVETIDKQTAETAFADSTSFRGLLGQTAERRLNAIILLSSFPLRFNLRPWKAAHGSLSALRDRKSRLCPLLHELRGGLAAALHQLRL